MTQKISQDTLYSIINNIHGDITELKRNATLLSWQLDGTTLQPVDPNNPYVIGVPIGGITSEHITTVNVNQLVGQINAGNIGSVNVGSLIGQINASQIGSVDVGTLVGQINSTQIGSVDVDTLIGQISANQIGSVNVSALIGDITASMITSVDVGTLIGQLSANQIVNLNANQIVGQLTADQILNLNAGQIEGLITAEQIGSVNAEVISGALAAGQITSINASSIIGGILAGQITSVNASAITGNITSQQIESITAGQISGSILAGQISAVNAGSIVGSIDYTQIGSVAAGSITGSITGGQIDAAAINGFTITGAIFRSGTVGARWQGDTSGITLWNNDNIITFKADTATGKITTLAGIGGGNLLKDGSGENSLLPDWSGSSATIATDATIVRSGFRSIKLTTTTISGNNTTLDANTSLNSNTLLESSTGLGNSAYTASASRPAVQVGNSYTASSYFRPNTTARLVRVCIDWYDVSGNRISISSGSTVTEIASQWVRAIATATAPANAKTAAISCEIMSASVGESHYIDDSQLEDGSIVTAYAPKTDEILPRTIDGTQLTINAGITGQQISSVIAETITGGITAPQITSVAATSITGSITSTQITSVAANTITGGITAGQITSVNAGAIVGSILAGQITSVNASAITGLIQSAQINTIAAGKIEGSILAGQIGAVNASVISGLISATQIGSIYAGNLIVGGSTADGKLSGALVSAGTILASHIAVEFPGGNKLLNSNFNDGLLGRSTPASSWLGPYEVTANSVLTDVGYYGGKALYGQNPNPNGGNPHVYTPYVNCSRWTKASFSQWNYAVGARQRRIVPIFYDATYTFISYGAETLTTAIAGWNLTRAEDVAVPVNATYVRFLSQLYACATNDEIHWAAATIQAGEKCTPWALAPGDLVPGSVTETILGPGSVATGHIKADAIDGKVITGATFQTSAAQISRVVINNDGIKQYGADGITAKVTIPSSGADAVFTGILNAKGLTFPDAALLPSNLSAISWGQTFSSGNSFAALYGYNDPSTGKRMILRVGPSSGFNMDYAELTVRAANHDWDTHIQVGVSNNTYSNSRIILSANGASDYAQLNSRAAKAFDFGVSGLVPAGGSLDVNYSCQSRLATVVQLTPYAVGQNVASPNYDVQSTSTIRIYNPNGFAYYVSWLALG